MHLEPPPGVYRLSLNENLFLPKELVASVTRRALEEVDPRLYTDAYGEGLAERLAEFHGVDAREVVVGPGADYVIYLLASLGRGSGVIIVEPTFEEYERAARLFGAPVTRVLLGEDFSLIPDRVKRASGRVVYMASPNNPTGNQYDKAAVEEVVGSVNGVVVVDEAYAEYGRYTLVQEAPSSDNLVVVRTFSKAWGLAGLRVGYAVANAGLARELRERGRVFATSALSLKAAELMLDHWREVRRAVEEAKLVRSWLIGELARIAKPYRSDANFVMVRLPLGSGKAREELLKRGFAVKDVGAKPLCENCIRVTVAPRQMSEKFLEALREVVQRSAQ